VKRSVYSPGNYHLSESEPQFHCPTLESVRVSAVTESILTCYKCLTTRKVIAPSAKMVPGDASYHRMHKKMCVISSAYAAFLRVCRFCGFFCFCFLHVCPVFLHPHTSDCSHLMDCRETGMIVMALGATLRLSFLIS